MHSGQLDRRVSVQSVATTEDALGTPVENWTDAADRWASISYGTGQERRDAAQENASLNATFTVRDDSLTRAIAPGTHRLTFDGFIWDIVTNAPSARRGNHRSITATARTS